MIEDKQQIRDVLKPEPYISTNLSSIMVRVPTFEQKNFQLREFERAIAYRDLCCDQGGIDAEQRKKVRRAKRNTGVGLRYDPKSANPIDPVGYLVTWMETRDGERKQRNKTFSFLRYGDQALECAKEHRAKMVKNNYRQE